MPNSSTNLKQFARRLLAHELERSKPSDAMDSAAFHVCERLRVSLAKLMGSGGFRAILSRGLVMASEEAPWLRELQIADNGSLIGLDEVEAKLGAQAVADGEVLLVAELLGLLITFIGPMLTERLLRDSWPDLKDLKF